MEAPQTLYKIANDEIRRCIDIYLKLAEQSKGLSALLPEHLPESRGRIIVMVGLGVAARSATAEEVCSEWQRRQAISFDLETGITAGVYTNLRTVAETFYEQLSEATGGFSRFDAGYVAANPYLLPPYSPTYRCLLYVTNAISLAVGDQVADSIRQGLQ